MLAEVTGDASGSHTGFMWCHSPLIDMNEGINGLHTLPGNANYDGTDPTGNLGFRIAGASSYHPGGCNVAMGDGSAHFLSQNIATRILEALTTRAGPSQRNIGKYGVPSTEMTISGPP